MNPSWRFPSRKRLCATALVLALGSGLLSGCVAVAPWDRDLLAKKAMALNTQPNLTAFHDHIYFSKEGSSGGRTSDGGGCGCN
jgi:hypothetical protein